MQNNESFLMRWSRFFITRYRISILILLAILIAGFWGVSNNQRQDFPNIPINFVFVTATQPGASPADIEQNVLLPIEQTALGMEGVESVRSTAQNSFGSVQVTLDNVQRVDTVLDDLSNDINKLGLPAGVETDVQTFDAAGPTIALGLVGTDDQGSAELLQYASAVQTELETASKEVKEIEILPENKYEITVTIDGEKLASNGLTYDAVKGALQAQITTLPGGTVETDDGRKQAITVNAPVQTLTDVQNISLGRVALGDIATVERAPVDGGEVHYVGYKEGDQAFAKESVYFLVYKNSDGDVIRISDAIREKMAEINDGDMLPDNVALVIGYDIAPYVADQLDSLLNNGYLGLLLILIVLLFFINFRTSLVVALAIPLVFLISLFIMQMVGFTLNILTLFAMILTLGILVDNAIVIAEGMVHELEKGADRKKAALTTVKKLGPAVLAATLTTMVVFIPFANIGGIMGDFLKYIPYTIMIVIGASFLVAVSIIPLFGRWFLKEESYDQRRASRVKPWQKALVLPAIVHYGQNVIDRLSNGYKSMMSRIYSRGLYKVIVIVLTGILLIGSFSFFAPQLTFEQFPSKDGNTIQVDFSFPAGTPFSEKEDVFIQAQDAIVQLPYFETFYTFGSTIFATFTEPVDRTDDTTIYDIESQYNDQLDQVRDSISEDILISAQAASYGPPSAEYDIVVEFVGQSQEALTAATDDLESFLANNDQVEKVLNGPRESLVPAVEINLDQERLSNNGVSSLVAAGTVNAIFSPQKVGTTVLDGEELSDEVTIEFASTSTDSVDDLKSLTVPTLTGGLVSLDSVASVNEVQNPVNTKRLDGRRVASFNVAVVEDGDIAAVNTAIEEYLTEDKLISYGLSQDSLKFGGEFADFESDYSNLQIIFILAVIAVYLILVYQFYSYMQPALILFAVPLALIGVFPGLLIVGSTLNMISGLGIIALVGIVVNDAIVLISTFNRYKEEYPDETFNQRLIRTGHTRFKPIFSTSITTIGGILPLTILDPFWTGLGTAIIAGLVFSTIGTLVSIPVLYSAFESTMNMMKKRLRRRKDSPTA